MLPFLLLLFSTNSCHQGRTSTGREKGVLRTLNSHNSQPPAQLRTCVGYHHGLAFGPWAPEPACWGGGGQVQGLAAHLRSKRVVLSSSGVPSYQVLLNPCSPPSSSPSGPWLVMEGTVNPDTEAPLVEKDVKGEAAQELQQQFACGSCSKPGTKILM